VSSVTFSTTVGGDGSTVTDDSNPTTGLANGGHRTRFVPALAQTVAVAANTVEKAQQAVDSAASAAASAASAAAIAGAFVSTSTTSWAPTIGSKAFAVQTGEQYTAGIFVTIVSASDGSVWGFGQVTAYSGSTLTVDVQVINGSATKADWNISLTGARGAPGAGITPQAVGFTASGGTAAKTLTVDVDLQASLVAQTLASQAEMEAGSSTALRTMTPLRIAQAIAALAPGYGLFRKADPTVVLFSKTGNFTVSTQTALYVEVNGAIKTIASGAVVTMPGTATAGTDYAIWAKTDGTLEATTNHTSPPTTGARKVGGFHYAPGGNATGTSGGNTTAQINQYSFWDLKFRPACPDPRGMTLIAGGFWADIYLTNTDPGTNGTSKYNVTIADGSSPPKIPTLYGGNGSTAYGSLTWFEAQEVAHAYGKRPLFQSEFMAAAYGTTEGSSIGTDQGSTILNAAYTSKWGLIQATGVMWVWGQERGGAYNTSGAWQSDTGGRGQSYGAPNAALFGGFWSDGAACGSRSSAWGAAASFSSYYIGLRCACDHLILD
jgi:hypothetical protein